MQVLSENIVSMAKKVGINFPTHTPIFNNEPKTSHLKSWAESQITPGLRDIARTIVDNLLYVSFQDFLAQLKYVVNDFNQRIKSSEYVLLIGEEREFKLALGSSDLWIIGLALEYCHLKAPTDIITLQELPDYLKNNQVDNVLMLDDAAYSAAQKGKVLQDLASAEILENVKFYLGIPFMTRHAEQLFLEYNDNFQSFCVLTHKIMPVMNEILDKRQLLFAKSAGVGYIDSRHTLTYFEHKFPDFYSAYQSVYFGYNICGASEQMALINFLGYACDSEVAKKLNIIQIEDAVEWNELFIRLINPNFKLDMFGFAIPKIISPYHLHRNNIREQLKVDMQKGKVGKINTNYVTYPEVEQIITDTACKDVHENFLNTTSPLVEQIAFDISLLYTLSADVTYKKVSMYRKGIQDKIKHFDSKNSAQPEKYINLGKNLKNLFGHIDELNTLFKCKDPSAYLRGSVGNELQIFYKRDFRAIKKRFANFSEDCKQDLDFLYPFIDTKCKQILVNILLISTVLGAFILAVKQAFSFYYNKKYCLFFDDSYQKAQLIPIIKQDLDSIQSVLTG